MSLARNTFVQASLTLASRILGFARDLVANAQFGGQGPLMDGDGTCTVHEKSHEARGGARPEVGRWRERDGGDLRSQGGRDFLRRQRVAIARELHAASGLA